MVTNVESYKKPSERNIYIWNIVGSMSNALFSVVVLMFVTRSLNNEHADIFSIAWSISQLMVIIGTFQMRTYQATDIQGKYEFKQYLVFRIATIIVMLITSLLYIGTKDYNKSKSLIVFILCVIRAIEALADVYEGWFQQKERLDLAGKTITYRVVCSTAIFGGVLWFTKKLLPSCIVLLMCYVGSFLICDLRYSRKIEGVYYKTNVANGCKWMRELFFEVLPVFVNAFLAMSIINAPKMAIDSATANGVMNEGVQTVFNILFMPASFINLAYIVFRPMITKMAIVWNSGRKKELLFILGKIGLCLTAVAILIIIGAAILGIPVLSLIYGVDLSNYKSQLLIIIVGGCFYTFSSVLDNALVAMRRQYRLILAYAVTWVFIQMVADIMVGRWSIMGAALAYTSAMGIFLLMTLMIFVFSYIKSKKRGC